MNFLVIDEEHCSRIIIGARNLEDLLDKLTDGKCQGYASSHGGAVGHLRVRTWDGEENRAYDVIVLDTLRARGVTEKSYAPASHRGVVPQEGYNPPLPEED